MDPASPSQPSPPDVEVFFCDLCNASVPALDLQQGKAVRVRDHVVGSCCLATLWGSKPAARAEVRTWPLAVIVLAAVAAGALHLDQRIERERIERAEAFERVETGARERAEVLVGVDRAVEALAESLPTEVALLQARVGGLQDALAEDRAQARAAVTALAEAVAAARAETAELARRQVDPAPALQRLEVAVQSLATAVAELRAMPAATPAVPQPGVVPPARQDASVVPPQGGLPAALAHQVARLADADPAVRFEAVDELVRSKDPQVGPALLPLAKDGDLFVRRLAVEGLRHFRSAAVLDALVTALADPEELVRESAWRSLQELTGQKLPFDPAASREVRSRAQKAWADWAEANKAAFGT